MSPIKVVEQANILMQHARIRYKEHERIIKPSDRKVAMDKMSDARRLKCDIERMIWRAQAEEAKRYLSSAREVLRTVKGIIDEFENQKGGFCPLGVLQGSSSPTTSLPPLSPLIETIPPDFPSSNVSTLIASKITSSGHKKHVERKAQDYLGRYARATTINTLPDGVLLDIFDFCKINHDAHGFLFRPILEWRGLTHVCQRWRHIVLSSPLRLDLQLLCTRGTPVRKNLDNWPQLPLTIDYAFWDDNDDTSESLTLSDEDNVMAALGHPNRARYVGISVTFTLLEKMAATMQEPFPVLTHLWLSSIDPDAPALPETLFGGSTPRLRVAHLEGIPFRSFPPFLLSAVDLVELQLLNIPETDYVSPDAMVASLKVLVRLEILTIWFQSRTSRPNGRREPPPTRAVFPSLSTFTFQGVHKYLENLVVQIDTPVLKKLTIMYLNRASTTFRIPRLSDFINRTVSLDLLRFKHARVEFCDGYVFVNFYEGQVEPKSLEFHFALQISCQWVYWDESRLDPVVDILNQSNVLSHVDEIFVDARDHDSHGLFADTVVEPSEWLQLLHLFTAVETLHVSKDLSRDAALALVEIPGVSVAEIMPALRSLFLEGEEEASIDLYLEARWISGHPVTWGDENQDSCSTSGSNS